MPSGGVSSLCVSPSGLKIIIHFTQGFAALTLGFYVTALRAFCRFAAVDLADGMDIVDGCCRMFCTFSVSTAMRWFSCTIHLKNLRHQRNLRIKQQFLAPRL